MNNFASFKNNLMYFFLLLFLSFFNCEELVIAMKEGSWSKPYSDLPFQPSFDENLPGSVFVEESGVFTHFYGDYAILWGGKTFKNTPNEFYYSSDLWYYSYSKKKFEFITGPKGEYDISNGDYPNGRIHSGFAVDNVKKKFYIVGGLGVNGCFRDIWMFSSESEEWELVYGNLNDASQCFHNPSIWSGYPEGIAGDFFLLIEEHETLQSQTISNGTNGTLFTINETNYRTTLNLFDTKTKELYVFGFDSSPFPQSGGRDEYFSYRTIEGTFETISLFSYYQKLNIQTKYPNTYGVYYSKATERDSNDDPIDEFFFWPGDSVQGVYGTSVGKYKRFWDGKNLDLYENELLPCIPSGVAMKMEGCYGDGELFEMEMVIFCGERLNPRYANGTISDNVFHYSFAREHSFIVLFIQHILYGSNPSHLFVPPVYYAMFFLIFSFYLGFITIMVYLCVLQVIAICPLTWPFIALLLPFLPVIVLIAPITQWVLWLVLIIVWIWIGVSSIPTAIGIRETQEKLHSKWTWKFLHEQVVGYIPEFVDKGYIEEVVKKKVKEEEKDSEKRKSHVDSEKLDEELAILNLFIGWLPKEKSGKAEPDFNDKLVGYRKKAHKIARATILTFEKPVFIPKLSQICLVGDIINSCMSMYLMCLAITSVLILLILMKLLYNGDEETFDNVNGISRNNEDSRIDEGVNTWEIIMILFTFMVMCYDFLYALFDVSVITVTFAVERICCCCFPEGEHVFDGVLSVNELLETIANIVLNEIIIILLFNDVSPIVAALVPLCFKVLVLVLSCDNIVCNLWNSGFVDDTICCFCDSYFILRIPLQFINYCLCCCRECCCSAIFINLGVDGFMNLCNLLVDASILTLICLLSWEGVQKYGTGDNDVPKSRLELYKELIFWLFLGSIVITVYFEVSAVLKPQPGEEELDYVQEGTAKTLSMLCGQRTDDDDDDDSSSSEEDENEDENNQKKKKKNSSTKLRLSIFAIKNIRYLWDKFVFVMISFQMDVLLKWRNILIVLVQAVMMVEDLRFIIPIPFSTYSTDKDELIFFLYIVVPVMFYVFLVFLLCDFYMCLPRCCLSSYFCWKNCYTFCDVVETVGPHTVEIIRRHRNDLSEPPAEPVMYNDDDDDEQKVSDFELEDQNTPNVVEPRKSRNDINVSTADDFDTDDTDDTDDLVLSDEDDPDDDSDDDMEEVEPVFIPPVEKIPTVEKKKKKKKKKKRKSVDNSVRRQQQQQRESFNPQVDIISETPIMYNQQQQQPHHNIIQMSGGDQQLFQPNFIQHHPSQQQQQQQQLDPNMMMMMQQRQQQLQQLQQQQPINEQRTSLQMMNQMMTMMQMMGGGVPQNNSLQMNNMNNNMNYTTTTTTPSSFPIPQPHFSEQQPPSGNMEFQQPSSAPLPSRRGSKKTEKEKKKKKKKKKKIKMEENEEMRIPQIAGFDDNDHLIQPEKDPKTEERRESSSREDHPFDHPNFSESDDLSSSASSSSPSSTSSSSSDGGIDISAEIEIDDMGLMFPGDDD